MKVMERYLSINAKQEMGFFEHNSLNCIFYKKYKNTRRQGNRQHGATETERILLVIYEEK